MARSQDSFSKKEKEKKRLKQRQEKAEKSAERKANTSKGKSLDDMMAYIDENGNISNSPPDPNKKRVYNAEDIQIGVPKHEDVEINGERTGTVAFFNDAKGFGFIKDSETGESVFVHINNLKTRISENDKVMFEVEMGQKGPVAINVKKV